MNVNDIHWHRIQQLLEINYPINLNPYEMMMNRHPKDVFSLFNVTLQDYTSKYEIDFSGDFESLLRRYVEKNRPLLEVGLSTLLDYEGWEDVLTFNENIDIKLLKNALQSLNQEGHLLYDYVEKTTVITPSRVRLQPLRLFDKENDQATVYPETLELLNRIQVISEDEYLVSNFSGELYIPHERVEVFFNWINTLVTIDKIYLGKKIDKFIHQMASKIESDLDYYKRKPEEKVTTYNEFNFIDNLERNLSNIRNTP